MPTGPISYETRVLRAWRLPISGSGKCSSKADFKNNLGEIHSGGVYCLLSDSKFQKGECRSNWHGGMSCYEHGFAPTIALPLLTPDGGTPIPDQDQTEWPNVTE